MTENRSKASRIFQIALFALSIGMLVYFCVSDNNLLTLLHSIPSLNPFWLCCAFGCMALNWLMDSMVIKTLVAQAYEADYGFRHAFKVTMVGQYFNSVTPYAVAGQPMQLLALTRQGVSTGVALSTLVRKFLIYQTTITCYSFLVILVKYQFFRSKIQGFMALAFIGFLYQAFTVVILALFTYSPRLTTRIIHGVTVLLTKIRVVKEPEEVGRKIRSQLEFYLETNRATTGNRLLGARLYGYTFLQLTALFAVPFFIYKAFHSPGAPFFDMIAAQSFVTMISGYTPLPGAAGAAEGSFLVIFQIFFSSSIIKQAMLLWRLTAYYSCIIVGAFFAGIGGRREKLKSRFGGNASSGKRAENGGTYK
jgi:hypothetical protein